MNITGLLLEGGLEIKFLEILIHVFNLIVLILFLKILVWNPVMKVIKSRQENLARIDNENKSLNAEVAKMQEQKDEIFETTRKEAEYITLQSTKEAEIKSKKIQAEGKAKADDLLKRAQSEIENQKMKLQQEIKEEAAELAVDIAEKILEREVSEKDNKKIIEDSLKGWEQK